MFHSACSVSELNICLNALGNKQVVINEHSVKAISLVNAGLINYDFVWDVGANPRISIKPETGCVLKGERLTCELAYNPHGVDRWGAVFRFLEESNTLSPS